jgi:hypothetical protein
MVVFKPGVNELKRVWMWCDKLSDLLLCKVSAISKREQRYISVQSC